MRVNNKIIKHCNYTNQARLIRNEWQYRRDIHGAVVYETSTGLIKTGI